MSEHTPRIFLFCNSKCDGSGGARGIGDWHSGVALAEDGHCLAGHLSSSHSFCKLDLGLWPEQDWSNKRAIYAKHYPDGFECVWVDDPSDGRCPELDQAYALNAKLRVAVGAA